MIRLHVHLRARSLSILVGWLFTTTTIGRVKSGKDLMTSRMSDRTQRATGTTMER